MGQKNGKEGAPQNAAGANSQASVVLVNSSPHTVLFKDRERDVYGPARYTIQKDEEVPVSLGHNAGTFYRLALFANIGTKSVNTRLHITTEDLAFCSKIVITCDPDNNYKLEKTAKDDPST